MAVGADPNAGYIFDRAAMEQVKKAVAIVLGTPIPGGQGKPRRHRQWAQDGIPYLYRVTSVGTGVFCAKKVNTAGEAVGDEEEFVDFSGGS